MWGREMRAGLTFVVASLLIGQGFREWKRGHETNVRDLIQELQVEDSSVPSFVAPDSGSHSLPSATHAKPPDAPVGAIDPNRASASELVRLPGIGPSLAARIVADRDQNGPFAGPEALTRVRGIGPKTLDRIRGFLSFPTPAGGDSLTGF